MFEYELETKFADVQELYRNKLEYLLKVTIMSKSLFYERNR